MKKIFKALLVLTLVLSMFGLAACSSAGTSSSEYPKEVTFGILRVPNDATLAIAANVLQDNFAELGIECKLVAFDSGVQANKALASGSVDFATMGNTNSIIALSKELDVQLVWIHEILGEVEALAVKDPSVENVEELAGKKIATPFASTAHYILLNVLKEAGIENDVTLLDMKTDAIVAAWIRGDIDAAYTWQPTLGELLKDGKMLVSSEDMVSKGYVTANVDVTRNGFAEQYPELVTLYIDSMAAAYDMYMDDPEGSAELIAKELDITAQETKDTLKGSIWVSREELISAEHFGTREAPGNFAGIMKDTSDFLLEQNSIDVSPDLEAFREFVNPAFIEMSLENGNQ